MAYRQPTFVTSRAPPRQSSIQQRTELQLPSLGLQGPEESQEWILFPSRQADSSIGGTESSFTARTTQTGGTKTSDLVSFDSALRSGRLSEEVLEEHELDSLDDNLHAFRETFDPRISTSPWDQNGGSVLPAHDGLGTFPSSHVQDQIWLHEQYNPKRKFDGHHRRRSSVQRRLDTIDEAGSSNIDEEKRTRIEQWRQDQSKALRDEIEKETRRRSRKDKLRQFQVTETESLLGTTPTQSDIYGSRRDEVEGTKNEPFWTKLTKRFIRDIVGIDESLLPVIFGEALPEHLLREEPSNNLASIPEQSVPSMTESSQVDSTWRERLLERVARELGFLVGQISLHPGAFTSYLSAPVHEFPKESICSIPNNSSHGTLTDQSISQGRASHNAPIFAPTLQDPENVGSWGLDEDDTPVSAQHSNHNENHRLAHDRDYWERDLDIKMLFDFLRNRFNPSSSSQSTITATTISNQESIRRGAVIRQHHPLVAKAHQRSLLRTRREATLHLIRRPSSSCASQSLRSSKRGSLVRSASSGRNYWDIGGSMGSESAIASGGMIGAWGEV